MLELPKLGNWNEYTQHSFSWPEDFSEIFLNICFLENFLGTQEQVQNNHTKRAIDVWVSEVLL